MTHVLFVGQKPDTVDFSDPSLPPGFDAKQIQAGINIAGTAMTERGWDGDICMIAPDDRGIAALAAQLATVDYDCVVIGGGLRLPPKGLPFFERLSTRSTRAHRRRRSHSTPVPRIWPRPRRGGSSNAIGDFLRRPLIDESQHTSEI